MPQGTHIPWGGAHPTARVDAHPDAHPPADQPGQPASQLERRGGIWQVADEPSEVEMDEAAFVNLNVGPISLVPSCDMVFEPCAELENNERPKALFVFPEAHFLGFIRIRALALPSYEPGTNVISPTKRRSPFVP